jgi:ubiquinone/menaquinone biosynthesis C-methylase UbiE
MNRGVQLFTYKNYCDESPLEKEILECGAGVFKPEMEPLFARFARDGYKVHGIDIAEERLVNARIYCEKHGIPADDLRQADMHAIPFGDESMPFVYAYNVIFHGRKADMRQMAGEMARVLMPGGILFINFLALEDDGATEGKRIGDGEYEQTYGDEKVIHAYLADDEAEAYFNGLEKVFKEKRVLQRKIDGEWIQQAFIDMILKKP